MTSSFKLYILARVELQLESLNASGAIGNYTKLQEGYVIIDKEPIPVPVITGNSLKNWHARAMAEKYIELGGTKIDSIHYQHMYRLPLAVANEVVSEHNKKEKKGIEEKKPSKRSSEEKIVSNCAICDLHGFLIAERGTPEHLQIKRESLVKFSFAVPIEEFIAKNVRMKYVITHNRVVPEVTREMMIFKREYASAIWAWEAVIDIASIGRSQLEKDSDSKTWLGKRIVKESDEIVMRAKAAVLAFEKVLIGDLGATTSRAIPIAKPVELVAILVRGSTSMPLHPYYKDYQNNLVNYINIYKDKVIKIYLINVKLKERISAEQPQLESQKIQLDGKIKDDYNNHYELLEELAKDIENFLKPVEQES